MHFALQGGRSRGSIDSECAWKARRGATEPDRGHDDTQGPIIDVVGRVKGRRPGPDIGPDWLVNRRPDNQHGTKLVERSSTRNPESDMRYRRARASGGIYFFTLVTHERAPVLIGATLQRLKMGFKWVKSRHPFQMPAYVLLPDHLHCIWKLPLGDDDFPLRWRLIKHYVSRAGPERPIWQLRYWEHLIRDESDYVHHVDYVHFNPVKHGLVRDPAEWPESSFRHYAKRERYPVGWGKDAMTFTGDFGE